MRDLSILNTIPMVEVSAVSSEISRAHYLILYTYISFSSCISLSHPLYLYLFHFMYLILSSCLSMSLSLHTSHSLFLFVSLHSFHCIGTGHGVGAALNVHEGPHSVSRVLNPQPLVAGMVVSK